MLLNDNRRPPASEAKPTKQPNKGSPRAAQSASSPDEIRAVRLQKVSDLRTGGHEPYAYRFDRTHYTSELQEEFKSLPDGAEDASVSVSVAGRVVAKRVMGKLAFLNIRDDKGQVQLYVEKTRLDEKQEGGFDLVKSLVDVGDIIGASGGIKRTDKGELSVLTTSISVLTKSLQPLPDKWHGLADVEKRYRQRYLDMIVRLGFRG